MKFLVIFKLFTATPGNTLYTLHKIEVFYKMFLSNCEIIY